MVTGSSDVKTFKYNCKSSIKPSVIEDMPNKANIF